MYHFGTLIYFDLAQSNLVVIKSRNHGSYKLVPVEDSDFIISDAELLAKINRGIAEFEQGRAVAIAAGESSEAYLPRTGTGCCLLSDIISNTVIYTSLRSGANGRKSVVVSAQRLRNCI